MRAVVTGATGLVGGNLMAALLNEGIDVRGTRRSSSRVGHLQEYPIEWVEADLGDADSLNRAFSGADVVFHCAAEVSFYRQPTPRIWAANVEGTQRVLDACRRTGVGRLVHCSSAVTCAISEDGQPATEEQPWNFDRHGLADSYSLTKREAERRVLAATDLDVVVVNPCYMFGPMDVKPSSGKLILNVAMGRVPAWTPGTNNFVDVRSVARGMILAWKSGRSRERYLLGGENMHYKEIFALIADVVGVAPPRFELPGWMGWLAGVGGDALQWATGQEMPLNSVTMAWSYCQGYLFSSTKAIQELGYDPTPVRGAIEDAVTWFKQNGMMS